MLPPRRLIPPLPALLAVEAVSRLGSATAAALELNLTPGAISRAIKEAEAQLATPLFQRDRQRLRPRPEAAAYLATLRAALDQLAQAGQRLRSGAHAGAEVTLAILPAFGMHWLAPRLADFSAHAPGVRLHLSTRLRPFDMAATGFDAAIHYGRPDWPGADHLLLMEEEIRPVAAPALLSEPLSQPDQVLTRPLLSIEGRAGDWGRWLAAQGLPGLRPQGMGFDQFATLKEAAIHGLGLALLPTFLIAADLAQGRLAPLSPAPWAAPVRGHGSYYLVWPKTQTPRPGFAAFREWVAGMVGQGDGAATPSPSPAPPLTCPDIR